jgi:CRISPR system Cascade subunit CasC
MKLIELHILQSFPVSCLNRDDVGAPKTAVFGGVTRARISSQCLKRAIRLYAKELCPALFAGERSKLIVRPIAEAVVRQGVPESEALEASKKFCGELATLDDSAFKSKGVLKVKTLMFLSPAERDEIGRGLATVLKEKTDAKTLDRKIRSAASKAQEAKLKDAADIALFGRMVATDHSLTVEGAAMFSHALSTHRADNDIDFYTAVDDRQAEDPTIEEEDRAGSGMMGTLEFTSACYYRYVGLNLGLLEQDSHLGALPQEDRRKL